MHFKKISKTQASKNDVCYFAWHCIICSVCFMKKLSVLLIAAVDLNRGTFFPLQLRFTNALSQLGGMTASKLTNNHNDEMQHFLDEGVILLHYVLEEEKTRSVIKRTKS